MTPGEPTRTPVPGARVAVLIPCFNESTTIADVVAAFRSALPQSSIHVYDNNSNDGTGAVARAAGATVRHHAQQGKGNVVRRMFADIDADIYVLVDGDATYDAPSARPMIAALLDDQLDMVVGARVHTDEAAYRLGHTAGNRLLTGFVAMVFGRTIVDMLSGYRILSRRFVKSFPSLSRGFEIETELTIHGIELGVQVREISTPYFARPEGSTSKLSTWSDGIRILRTIVRLYQSERPLAFFSGLGLILAVIAVALATPVVLTFLSEGRVPRLPTAVLATGMMLSAFLSFACGVILDTVTRARRELKLLAYLGYSAPDFDSGTFK